MQRSLNRVGSIIRDHGSDLYVGIDMVKNYSRPWNVGVRGGWGREGKQGRKGGRGWERERERKRREGKGGGERGREREEGENRKREQGWSDRVHVCGLMHPEGAGGKGEGGGGHLHPHEVGLV